MTVNRISAYSGGVRQGVLSRAVSVREGIRLGWIVTMGFLLLEFFWRMVTVGDAADTSHGIILLQSATALAGIWLGKSWKDKGFRFLAFYLLWSCIRLALCGKSMSVSGAAVRKELALLWAIGGCYSLGRVMSRKELGKFLLAVGAVWTAGMVASSCLGIHAAWNRIRIPNLDGTRFWRLWGDADSARLNLVYISTISGSILSSSILISLLLGISSKRKAVRAAFFLAVLPMVLALCLTDSRTAQISLSAGLGLMGALALQNVWKRRKGIAFLAPAALLIAGAVLWALLHTGAVFDRLKEASVNWPILRSSAMLGADPVYTSGRGLAGEDVLVGRPQIWLAALQYLRANPTVLLTGTSAVNSMAGINLQPALTFSASHCHNILLQILVETGIPGLAAVAGFLWITARKSLRCVKQESAPLWRRLLPCLLVTICAGELVECLTWLGFRYTPVPFFLFAAAGLVAAAEDSPDVSDRKEPPARKQRWWIGPALLCLCVLLALPLLPRGRTVRLENIVQQDSYDDPETDLYYLCGDENCETHGGRHTIKTSGCGLCAVANAAWYLTGNAVDVHRVADFARENGEYVVHAGSSTTLVQAFAENAGAEFGVAFAGEVKSLEEATHLLREGCAVIAGVGNAEGGGHLLVLADYDPLTGKYLILDSAGNYDHWSGSFFSWQSVRENHLELNPDVYLTSFRAIRPL